MALYEPSCFPNGTRRIHLDNENQRWHDKNTEQLSTQMKLIILYNERNDIYEMNHTLNFGHEIK